MTGGPDGSPREFFRWWIVDERTGKRRLTTYKMQRAVAEERFPGAEPNLQSREVRQLREPGEIHGNSRPPREARTTAELALSSCAFCEGSGWICADHPALPFQHDNCGAEGAPCVCNPTGAVQWREVYAELPPKKPPH